MKIKRHYIPGYFEAKLLLDGNIVRAHDLYIKSSGWLATIDYTPVPKYLKSAVILNGKLSLPAHIVDEISMSEQPINSTFHYVDDFGDVSGDNFRLSTSIKNTYREKWAVCQTTKIIILDTTGIHIIPFTLPGCVSDINLRLHDNYINGKKYDLSALGVNFSTARSIQISIKNKQVTIGIDGVEVFQDAYNDAIGRLVGLRFRFTGAGEIETLEVKNVQRTIDEPVIHSFLNVSLRPYVQLHDVDYFHGGFHTLSIPCVNRCTILNSLKKFRATTRNMV